MPMTAQDHLDQDRQIAGFGRALPFGRSPALPMTTAGHNGPLQTPTGTPP